VTVPSGCSTALVMNRRPGHAPQLLPPTVDALAGMAAALAGTELAPDERRRIFEESSRHVASGLEYLPAVARRLHHGRDLGEPFDFLTWFEFAPEDATHFEELVRRLRATEEWSYVEREVDLRLARD
jgi:hypothetical protein